MKFVLAALMNSGIAWVCCAGELKPYWPQDYERDVSKWQEVTPGKRPAQFEPVTTKPLFWDLKWLLRSEKGKIVAESSAKDKSDDRPIPPFKPRLRGEEMPPDMWIALPVDDGWVIAFDMGEFGAAVVWYNKDGSKTYELGHEYIQQLLVTPDGIFGQGGTTHMGVSVGALTRLDKKGGRWEMSRLFDTPAYAPIQWLGNHNLLIVQDRQALSVYFAPYAAREWGSRSLSLPTHIRMDETKYYACGKYAFTDSKLYTGGRRYVAELDLYSLKVRFLIPDSRFLNDDLRTEVALDDGRY